MTRMCRTLVNVLLAGLILVGTAAPGFAEPKDRGWRNNGGGHQGAREEVRRGRILPLESVLANVRSQFAGDLLDADLVDQGGRPVYRIKLLVGGRGVTVVYADAQTGAILGAR